MQNTNLSGFFFALLIPPPPPPTHYTVVTFSINLSASIGINMFESSHIKIQFCVWNQENKMVADWSRYQDDSNRLINKKNNCGKLLIKQDRGIQLINQQARSPQLYNNQENKMETCHCNNQGSKMTGISGLSGDFINEKRWWQSAK